MADRPRLRLQMRGSPTPEKKPSSSDTAADSNTSASHRRLLTQDGAVYIPQLASSLLVEALSEEVQKLEAKARSKFEEDEPAFIRILDVSSKSIAIGNMLRRSSLPAVAGGLMQAQEVQHFADLVFIKDKGCLKPTPPHQDLPYWSVGGDQIISIWLALTPVPLGSGLCFLRGSHLSSTLFKPSWLGSGNFFRESNLQEPPDLLELPPDEILTWGLAKGDAIAFSARTLHWAPVMSRSVPLRRAFVTRWVGDNVHYLPKLQGFPAPCSDLVVGRKLPENRFPILWRRCD